MADLKISQLNNGDPAQTNDQIPINRGGANFRITAGSISALPPTTAGANQVIYVDSAGTSLDGDSTFVYTAATGRLGIGTSSPSNGAKLDAAGAIISTATTLSTFNANNAGFDFIAASKIGRFFATSTDTTGGTMTFTTGQNGTYQTSMTILNSGNVGIGTTSPLSLLDVSGTAPVLTLNDSRASATWSAGTALGKLDFYTSDITGIGAHSVASIGVVAGGSNTASPDGVLVFSTGAYNTVATEKMRLDSSGNLGLGVTPSAWGGSYRVVQTASGGSQTGIFNGSGVNGALTFNAFNNGSNWLYQNTASAGIFDFNFAASNGFSWRLAPSGTAGNAITFTQAMTLDANSRLLVGTTTNTNTSQLVAGGTISETVSSVQYLVASQFDVGTAPNQIPLNQYLGTMAFQDSTAVSVGQLRANTSSGIGYSTGAGGTVTQGTSRTTGVTLNTICGSITLFSAAGTTTWQSFTVTNSAVAATDTIIVNQRSGTDLNMIHVTNVAAGSFRISFATTGGTTTEQPVFNFAVIKAVTA